MNEWREGQLAAFCESIDYGFTASANSFPVGPKFLRITDIVGNALDWDTVPFVEADSKTAEKYQLHDGDIVIARTGATTGESRYIKSPPNAIFASYLVRLKIDKCNDSRYVAYWLKSPFFREYLCGVLGDKSAQPNASASTMTQAPIRVPADKEYQIAISAVLGSLDDKIDLNRRMNETLEAMARAIFKDWFVDFGPVRAKAESRPPYLAPDLWALFPDALDDDDKPVGWSVVPLSEFAYLNPESWSKNHRPVKIKYVDLANTKWGVIEATQRFNWKEAPSRAQRILRPGDTIVGTVRPGNGSFSFIGQDGFTGSTGFAVLRPKMDRYREFLYLSATSSENIERLTHLADGAAYPAVRPDIVIQTESVRPNEELLSHFSEIVEPLFSQIESNKVMSKDLAQLRDLLLPKLMSGETRLRDAEKTVKDTL